MDQETPILAVIGGSGLYEMPGLADAQALDLETPYGKPSAPVVIGSLSGRRVAFLARHGIGHTISPSEINYRANIYALKSLGVDRIVSISACGSLREDLCPGSHRHPGPAVRFHPRQPQADLLRGRPGRPRRDGRSILPGSFQQRPSRRSQDRGNRPRGRDVYHHRRTAFLHQSRIEPVPCLGNVDHRDDRLSRGLPGPRS